MKAGEHAAGNGVGTVYKAGADQSRLAAENIGIYFFQPVPALVVIAVARGAAEICFRDPVAGKGFPLFSVCF